MEDSEIITKILNGNIDHYQLLIKRYQLKLQSTLSFYCLNSSEIEYIMHEAFVKAYSKLHQYKAEYPFFPWLKTLALNLWRDEFRSKKTLSEQAKEFLLAELMQVNVPDNRLETLKKCLTHLEESQQELIKMRYWGGLSIEELAEKLERTNSAVKMQILRIRESLKKCIVEKSGITHG